MESIDKLREYMRKHGVVALPSDILCYIEAIEQELAERYVALPLDADGVPIHVGDDMDTLMRGYEGEHCPVICIGLTEDGWEVDGDAPSSMLHHRPDTWERIIDDAIMAGTEGGFIDIKPLVDRCRALAKEQS